MTLLRILSTVLIISSISMLATSHSRGDISDETEWDTEVFLELLYRDSTFGGGGLSTFLPENYISPAKFSSLSYEELLEIYLQHSAFQIMNNSVAFDNIREYFEIVDIDDSTDTVPEIIEKAVFGNFDVQDIDKVTGVNIKRNASIVCAIFYLDGFYNKLQSDGSLVISPAPKSFNLCHDVPFRDQRTVASGTAFAISDSTVCSAYHYNYTADKVVFVFNYTLKDDAQSVIPANRVFEASRIMKSSPEQQDDFAIYLLKKKLPAQWSPIAVPSGVIAANEPIYMIGHPFGWPMKISDNSFVKAIRGSRVLTDLDKFHFNSGSPVFCAKTHSLVGMLLRGGTKDFIDNGRGCRSAHIENYDSLRASVFIRITSIE